MNSASDQLPKPYGRLNSGKLSGKSDVFEPSVSYNDYAEVKQRAVLVEWINALLNLNLPAKASSEELRAWLSDGTVLLQILHKLRPGSVNKLGSSQPENVGKFLASMDELGISRFESSDLLQGSMKPVVDCLLAVRARFIQAGDTSSASNTITRNGSPNADAFSYAFISPSSVEEKRNILADSKLQQSLRSHEPAAPLVHHLGHKFHEVFQLKQGRYADLSAARISEMMKSNSLDNAPTQSLLSVVNGILDEGIERKNGEIPHRVACLLRKVVLEIERRISTQAEHLRTQNNLFKTREEKYQSRIRVLEALAAGSVEETRIATNQLQQAQNGKSKVEEKKNSEDIMKLMKEKEQKDLELSALRRELEIGKRTEEDFIKLSTEKTERDNELSALRRELEIARRRDEDLMTLMKEKAQREIELLALRHELERARSNDDNMIKLMKEKETKDLELSALRKELEIAKRADENVMKMMKEKERNDLELSLLRQELEVAKKADENVMRLRMEKERNDLELSSLRQELEIAKKVDENVRTLMKEKEERKDLELSTLRKKLEIAKRADENVVILMKEKEKNELDLSVLRQELEVTRGKLGDMDKVVKEKEQSELELSALKKEIEMEKRTHELRCLQMETEAKGTKISLEGKLIELGQLLEDSTNKIKALEAESVSTKTTWNEKENILQNFVNVHVNSVEELRSSSQSIKYEILKAKKSHSEDLNILGTKLKALIHATKNYHLVLAENRKLFNDLQDLKGNIRVYCRIRPFLPRQAEKKTIVEYIGETGELVVANPTKQSKDGHRMFRFNKVYDPEANQAEVFSDTQPLVRSVLDGYNVCIFAYGQTGSGKTYTMTGPNNASAEEWGVNYRALNDLFSISRNRSGSFTYEVGVQMIEIYNEQVRDMLSSESSQKRLGIVSISQAHGLAVPDATMQAVTSTSDVIKLMDLGLKNRAVSATALNERSSRSHSVVSIHVRGKDLHNGATLQGNLHLVDLAGSERVDRSEVTGDRLKEAQHINKSLSALGDVIFALAQKNSHIPYRNSKLTQLLQASLGGQAKTLMFVQLNPDLDSYSESMSTLKFAERVSGVELGAAKSSKDGRDVRELMEQVASLKDTISKKDDEIDRLQLLKDLKGTGSTRPGYESSDSTQRSQKTLGEKCSVVLEKINSDQENSSEYSERHSEDGSLPSMDNVDQDNTGDPETLDYGDGDSEERLSEISDGDLSVGAEHNITTEEGTKHLEKLRKHGKVVSKIRSLQKAAGQTTSTTVSVSRDSMRASTSVKKTNAGNSTMLKPARRI